MPKPRPLSRRRPTRRLELSHWRNGLEIIAGLDEVGRGPLAGPLVTAAVVLPSNHHPRWLSDVRDSKQLSPAQRQRLAPRIRAGAVASAVGWVQPDEIDRIGLSASLRLACRRTIALLPHAPDLVLADGRDDLRLPYPTEMIVKGDAAVASIAAASILAKAARDAWMRHLDLRYPDYGFARHKGYPAPQHLEALRQLGPCPEHRRSFAPVAASLQPSLSLHAAQR